MGTQAVMSATQGHTASHSRAGTGHRPARGWWPLLSSLVLWGQADRSSLLHSGARAELWAICCWKGFSSFLGLTLLVLLSSSSLLMQQIHQAQMPMGSPETRRGFLPYLNRIPDPTPLNQSENLNYLKLSGSFC